MRKKNKIIYSDYFEVFLDTPKDIVRQRDVKGIYKKFDEGIINHVVGMDIPFIKPTTSDLVLSQTQKLSDLGVKNSRLVEKGNLIMSICATVGRPILMSPSLSTRRTLSKTSAAPSSPAKRWV